MLQTDSYFRWSGIEYYIISPSFEADFTCDEDLLYNGPEMKSISIYDDALCLTRTFQHR